MIESVISGCYSFPITHHVDRRGSLFKPFARETLAEFGLSFDVAESFFSVSGKNVLRGMHFQTPPFAYQKITTCLRGKILDVVIDLRKSSPFYGQVLAHELDAKKPVALVIPRGFAHGFLALEEDSLVAYWQDQKHAPSHDEGILWSSLPFAWPTTEVIVSERDRAWKTLYDYDSPF